MPKAPVTPIDPDKFLFQPATWFEQLDLAGIFGTSFPLEVELGSGDGSFLIDWARRHPDRQFIGVERLLGRIRKLDRKAQRVSLTNVRGLRIEASYCLEHLLPPDSVSALHVYFPDPWPKRRHHKNRLVNERFVILAHQALQVGAAVHFRTDNADYFGVMKTVFSAAPGFREGNQPSELAELSTDFEREFNARGISTLRASYWKV